MPKKKSKIRRVDEMKGNPITRDLGRQRLGKIIYETVKKDLEVNWLSIDMIYTRPL